MNARSTTMTGPNFLDALLALPRMLLQGVEAMMGRMGMMPPPGMPPPRPGPAAPAFSGPPAAQAPPAIPVNIVPTAPPVVSLAVRRDRGAGSLEESGVKLVEYAIVSVRRGAERILPGAGGQVIVTGTMSEETFAIWIIAAYLQSRGPIPPEDRKYLRVSSRVLERWDREPLHFEGLQLLALEGIRRAIVDCCDGFPLPVSGGRARAALPPARPAAPAAVLPAAPAAAAPSEEAKRVLAALKKLGAKGGATSALVRQSGLTTTQVRRSLRELEAAGRIRRSGQGLQTRYHPVEE